MKEITTDAKLSPKDKRAQGVVTNILKDDFENVLAVHKLLSNYMALATKALRERDLGDMHRSDADPIYKKLQTIASKINHHTPSFSYDNKELRRALKQLLNKPGINANVSEKHIRNIEEAIKQLPKLDDKEATGKNLDLVRKLAKAQVLEEALEEVLGYINRLAHSNCEFKSEVGIRNTETRLIETDFDLGYGSSKRPAGKILILTNQTNSEKQPDTLCYVTNAGCIFKAKSYNVVHSVENLYNKDLFERLETVSKEYAAVTAKVLSIKDTSLTDDHDFKEIIANMQHNIVDRALRTALA